MKKVFFQGQQVRIVSSFENRNLHLGADLSELLRLRQDLERIQQVK